MPVAAPVPNDLMSRFQAVAGNNPAPGATPKPPHSDVAPPPAPSDDMMARFGKVAQEGTSAAPQQAEQSEDTDFLSRASQTSGIHGLIESAKAHWDAAKQTEDENQAVIKQVTDLAKAKDFGRATELLLSHLTKGALMKGATALVPGGEAGLNVAENSAEHLGKMGSEFGKGNIGEGVVEAATAVPVVGPMARSIAEPAAADIKSGNLEGVAGDVVGGAAQIGSLLLGREGGGAAEEPGLVRPGKVELAGEKIPVRASAQEGAKGKVGAAAEYTADSGKLKQFDVEKTQPAARKATSNVASEAADTGKSATTPAKEDAFGFGKASDELQARSKTVFQKLDKLSEREFSDAQQEASDARQDYTAAGRKAYRAALDKQESLFTKYQSEFEPGALDKAKADWAKSQGLEDLRVRFNRSVHPTPVELAKSGEQDMGYVNGKTFRESITDALQKDKYGKNEFERAGFSPDHVQTVEEIGRILEKGNNLHRLNPIMKLAAHGGMGMFGLLGHPAEASVLLGGEFAIGKAMGSIMTNPKASSTLLKGLKSSATAAAIANALQPYLKEEKK